MANVIKKGGLRLKSLRVDQELQTFVHASDDSVKLGVGDPVKLAGTSAQIGNGPYRATVALCASGDAIFGVVEGVDPLSAAQSMNLDRRYCPASTAMYVQVRLANPYDVYAITEDGAIATTSVGMVADITGNGGGTSVTECDTASGLSTVMLDSSTAASGSSATLKIIGFEDVPDNTPGSTNSSVLVIINETAEVGAGGNGV